MSFENDSTANYLVFRPEPDQKLVNYQVQMLLNNRIHGILNFHLNYFGDQVNCFYDITSKCTLVNIMNRKKFTRCDFLKTLLMIINSIISIKYYLLNDSNILLDENNIYVDPENMNVYFVYLPLKNNSSDIRAFLIKMIVKLAKFQEEDSDNYLQKVLENIKNDLFNLTGLKELLENLLGQNVQKEPLENSAFDNNGIEPVKEIKVKAQRVEKQKLSAPRGEVKMPHLMGDNKNNNLNVNIKHKEPSNPFSKSTIAKIILQPIFIVFIIYIITSDFVQMSDNPKTTIGILSLIFVAIDILIIRIINEKKSESDDSYKPLQFITEKMKEKSTESGGQATTVNEQRKAEEIRIQKENTHGETVILKKDKMEKIPYLKENNGDDIIKVDKKSVLIGRMESFVDHIVNSNAVGKVHAEIVNEDGIHYVIDCSSRNGTYVNDDRIVSNTKIKINNNDVIRFANKEYLFVIP